MIVHHNDHTDLTVQCPFLWRISKSFTNSDGHLLLWPAKGLLLMWIQQEAARAVLGRIWILWTDFSTFVFTVLSFHRTSTGEWQWDPFIHQGSSLWAVWEAAAPSQGWELHGDVAVAGTPREGQEHGGCSWAGMLDVLTGVVVLSSSAQHLCWPRIPELPGLQAGVKGSLFVIYLWECITPSSEQLPLWNSVAREWNGISCPGQADTNCWFRCQQKWEVSQTKLISCGKISFLSFLNLFSLSLMPLFHHLCFFYIWRVVTGFPRQWNINSWSGKRFFLIHPGHVEHHDEPFLAFG